MLNREGPYLSHGEGLILPGSHAAVLQITAVAVVEVFKHSQYCYCCYFFKNATFFDEIILMSAFNLWNQTICKYQTSNMLIY